MSSKPESTFIAGVHKHLPRDLHREKMHNAYRGGTPDVFYSGSKSDLWVEYKFIPKLPTRETTVIVPNLSDLQLQWLAGRQAEGRNVAVIIGVGVGKQAGGIVFLNSQWIQERPPSYYQAHLRSRQDIAAWLVERTMR